MPRASSGGAKKRAGAPKATGAARARARDIDAIVVEIAELIATSKWVPGETVKEFATREGVTPRQAETWAVEAGRFLRVGKDVEKRRVLNLRRLDETYRVEKGGKVRVAVVAEQNKMLGLHAPTKVDVRVEQYESLPVPALHAKLVEQRRKLTESIDALEKQHPELVSPAQRLFEGGMKAVGIGRIYDISATPADRTEGQDE